MITPLPPSSPAAAPPDDADPVASVEPLAQGYVHSVESAGMLDGPGLRYVIFLSGCPLRCLYCHNPDTACLTRGNLRPATDLLDEIRHQLPFLTRGGGLTVSGGEPLVQPGFLKTLLRGAKSLGLHTAVDTTGYLGHRADPELLDLTDLWLLDLKSWQPDTYRAVTGVDLAPTLAFARRLVAADKKMWIRFVLVPGLTDAPDNIDGVARFAASLGPAVERIEVLPFHKMGEYKWAQLGLPYALTDTPPCSPELAESARARFRAHGLETH